MRIKKEYVFHKGIFSLNRPMTIVYLDVDVWDAFP